MTASDRERPVSGETGERFYDELDHVKAIGKGSCCTMWSFLGLLGTLLILGCVALLLGI